MACRQPDKLIFESRELIGADDHGVDTVLGEAREGNAISVWLLALCTWSRSQVRAERPETWVTPRTGHMGNTFRLRVGGVDAVEGVFGRGRAPAVCVSAVGWRDDDGRLPRVRDFAE